LLAKAYQFTIMGLSNGQFKVKSLNRTHLSEMFEMFDDIQKIRLENNLIMIVNNKLVKHTGHMKDPEIQALVGLAVKKKFLKFESATDPKSPMAFLMKDGSKKPSLVQDA